MTDPLRPPLASGDTVAPRASRVLGIDPGTRVAGWGLVESAGPDLRLVAAGVVRAPGEISLAERLVLVFRGFEAVLAEHRPDLVVVEEVFFGKNVQSALRLGEGRAVAILAASLAGSPLVQLATSLVKKAVVGHGGATKDQVRSAVEVILGRGTREATADLPADATDALALAIAGHARASSPAAAAGARRPKRRARAGWSEADLARFGAGGSGSGS